MYAAGLFGTDAHHWGYGYQCKNIDQECRRSTSRQSAQNESRSMHLEMRSTMLNSLMWTKCQCKKWWLWKECRTPHPMVITTTVSGHYVWLVLYIENKFFWKKKHDERDSRSRRVKVSRRDKDWPNKRELNTSTHPQLRRTSHCDAEKWDWETW